LLSILQYQQLLQFGVHACEGIDWNARRQLCRTKSNRRAPRLHQPFAASISGFLSR
jgi:hypothetical protein